MHMYEGQALHRHGRHDTGGSTTSQDNRASALFHDAEEQSLRTKGGSIDFGARKNISSISAGNNNNIINSGISTASGSISTSSSGPGSGPLSKSGSGVAATVSAFTSRIASYFSAAMTRPRTSSVRLPLYENNSNRVSPRLRNGSPPKVRRKRSMLLNQVKYSSLWRFRSTSMRTWKSVLRVMVGCMGLVTLFLYFFVYEPHVEVQFYPRSWIEREVRPVEPLAGCFDTARVSPRYNLTQARIPKRTEVQAGMPMRLGLDCYDFAGTVQPAPRHGPPIGSPPPERVNFHTYWRADLVPFGERQEWMVKSFFATQDLARSRLILWSNGDLRSNEMVRRWARKYPDAFQLKIVDVEALARGTALEASDLLYAKDSKAWVDGDLVRLLVTWAYGGVWVDMDSLLTRDLSPLLEHEFVTQWDCYDKVYSPMNGAVMHFLQHSPYLCEAFEIMARSPPPKSGTTEWGALLYFKLWRRLIAGGVPPFKILPFCFTDGRSCRLDNRLPDPFGKDKDTWAGTRGMHEGSTLDITLGKIFSVHLHNQWHKSFPRGGWVERLLLRRYDRALGIESTAFGAAPAMMERIVAKDG